MNIWAYYDKDILPFSEACRKVRDRENFSLARFGDGEMYAILKQDLAFKKNPALDRNEANCDGHKYFPAMGKELAHCFLTAVENPQPNFYIGIHTDRRCGPVTAEWLQRNRVLPSKRKFCHNGIFHDPVALKHGQDIQDFFNALAGRRVILVGPPHLSRVRIISPSKFVVCPEKDSYLASADVLKAINLFIQPNDVVLFCAGMPAPIWIFKLFKQYRDTVTLIDFGSVLDPFAGVQSRSFHKKTAIP